MFVPLLLLLIAVPLAELFVIIEVGQAIGALPTIALLLVLSALGAALMRAQGRVVWHRFLSTLGAGRLPAREVIDGALILFGGALLLFPGFLTDAVGLLFLLPPTRAAVRKGLLSSARARMVVVLAGNGAASRGRARQDYDVDSTGHDLDGPGHLPR